jgi:alkaline phosphatase D
MALDDADVALHLGDISYNDGAYTLEEYHAKWHRTFEQQGYKDFRASAGWYVTWDDHEVTDNYNPERLDAEQIANARQAFVDNMAIDRQASDPMWMSFQWGDTAEFLITDLRSERLPSTRADANPVFISQAQMDWLKQRLLDSTAHFKLLFSSVNIGDLPGPWDAAIAYDDRWEGYGAQREELLDFIVENDIENVWSIAGDIHVGFVSRMAPQDTPYSHMWEITVGPGGSGTNPLGDLWEIDYHMKALIFPCDQFPFAHGRTAVTTKLVLDPGADTIRVQFVDVLTDEVLFDDLLQQER